MIILVISEQGGIRLVIYINKKLQITWFPLNFKFFLPQKCTAAGAKFLDLAIFSVKLQFKKYTMNDFTDFFMKTH